MNMRALSSPRPPGPACARGTARSGRRTARWLDPACPWLCRRRENMVGVNMLGVNMLGVNMVVHDAICECFEGNMLEPCLLKPCFHVAGCAVSLCCMIRFLVLLVCCMFVLLSCLLFLLDPACPWWDETRE